jgi:flagellar hook-length control protein FliK
MELLTALPSDVAALIDPTRAGAAPLAASPGAETELRPADDAFASCLELLAAATAGGDGLPLDGKVVPTLPLPETPQADVRQARSEDSVELDLTAAGAALPAFLASAVTASPVVPPALAPMPTPPDAPLVSLEPASLPGDAEAGAQRDAAGQVVRPSSPPTVPPEANASAAPAAPVPAPGAGGPVPADAGAAVLALAAAAPAAVPTPRNASAAPPAAVRPSTVAPKAAAELSGPVTVPASPDVAGATPAFELKPGADGARVGPAPAPLEALLRAGAAAAPAAHDGAPAAPEWLAATPASAGAAVAPAPAPPSPAPPGTPVDLRADHWHEAFAGKIQWLVDQRLGEAHIKLNPPELGAVDVKISLVEDKTYVQLTAAHATARDELAQSLPRLRELLTASGLEFGGASVHGGRDGQSGRGYEPAPRGEREIREGVSGATEAAPRRVVRARSAIDVFA